MNMHLTRSVPYVGVHDGYDGYFGYDGYTQASQYLDRKHGSNVILSHNREFQTQLPECETPAGAEYILLNWV